jgi:hypothetical protein
MQGTKHTLYGLIFGMHASFVLDNGKQQFNGGGPLWQGMAAAIP